MNLLTWILNIVSLYSCFLLMCWIGRWYPLSTHKKLSPSSLLTYRKVKVPCSKFLLLNSHFQKIQLMGAANFEAHKEFLLKQIRFHNLCRSFVQISCYLGSDLCALKFFYIFLNNKSTEKYKIKLELISLEI